MSTDIQVTSQGTDEQLVKCPGKVGFSPFLSYCWVWRHWEGTTSSIVPWISSFGSGSGSSCSWWCRQPLLHHLLQVWPPWTRRLCPSAPQQRRWRSSMSPDLSKSFQWIQVTHYVTPYQAASYDRHDYAQNWTLTSCLISFLLPVYKQERKSDNWWEDVLLFNARWRYASLHANACLNALFGGS